MTGPKYRVHYVSMLDEHAMAESASSVSERKTHTSPRIPVSMIALTTAALAVPLALLRRQRVTPIINWRKYPSQPAFAPPVRRAPGPPPDVPSIVPPPPRATSVRTLPISTTATPSANAGAVFRRPSEEPSPTSTEDGFEGVLYSLKAFSIATAVVVAGGAASVWGVKTYLGVKDTQEFASVMRLTLRNTWPFLVSRIHRTSDSTRLSSPVSLPVTASTGSEPEPPDGSSLVPVNAESDVKGWNWPEAQARLATAYEHGGVPQFAEAAASELEAELELERRKRSLVDPSADTS